MCRSISVPLARPPTRCRCAARVIRTHIQPKTIGDHIRKRRLVLKMIHRQVADEIGVDTTCVFNWEADKSKPEIRYMPQIS